MEAIYIRRHICLSRATPRHAHGHLSSVDETAGNVMDSPRQSGPNQRYVNIHGCVLWCVSFLLCFVFCFVLFYIQFVLINKLASMWIAIIRSLTIIQWIKTLCMFHELSLPILQGTISVGFFEQAKTETVDSQLRLETFAIGPVSVSRYTARLRAIGADLGTGH